MTMKPNSVTSVPRSRRQLPKQSRPLASTEKTRSLWNPSRWVHGQHQHTFINDKAEEAAVFTIDKVAWPVSVCTSGLYAPVCPADASQTGIRNSMQNQSHSYSSVTRKDCELKPQRKRSKLLYPCPGLMEYWRNNAAK